MISLTMTSVNAFATLLEAFFNIFSQTHTHIDTKALLYPCYACACWVITKSQPVSLLPRPVCRKHRKGLVTLGNFLYVLSQQP